MRVLVAMSGGVDSSMAAALLVEDGHEVVGATMILWPAASADSGCCSAAEVDDARRVCDRLGVAHHVFDFSADFEDRVVGPYVAAHAAGLTPNPCLDCNRYLKFDRFVDRARRLGFDAVATGHHARVVRAAGSGPDGPVELRRGADPAKDQSYVLAVLQQDRLRRILLPVGELTKAEVRRRAAALGLRTAAKPDSQDVCFVTASGGRDVFLATRLGLRPGRVLDAATGTQVGAVPAVELVTVGQRRRLGGAGGLAGGRGEARYALATDPAAGTVTVGSLADLLVEGVALDQLSWTDRPVPPGTTLAAQCSAHGPACPAVFDGRAVRFDRPRRAVAPGQTVALYDGDRVLGAGVAVAGRRWPATGEEVEGAGR
ncbi:MAG TPA: tRNA 2-thiouridine(34) synthase MnmA [Acidimicrobiales bacterium]|nr:tRNA 2-thiouridine(34) synthase MnmA [Acidimicrobiales bacterium]